MSTNSLLTVATMQGVFTWNDFIQRLYVYKIDFDENGYTWTERLRWIYGYEGLGSNFSAIVVTVLPTFIFYFFTNKYMLSGLTAGAVKG